MDESLNFNNMLPTERPLRDNTNYQQRKIGRYSNVRMMHTSTSKIVNCQKSKEATQSLSQIPASIETAPDFEVEDRNLEDRNHEDRNKYLTDGTVSPLLSPLYLV